MKLRTRRIFYGGLLTLLSVFILLLHHANTISIEKSNFISGWILLVLMAFLASYNIRKKLPFLPLGRSSRWLQGHLLAGTLAILIFLCHIDFQIPNGFVEVSLTLLFLLITASGLLGIAISRYFSRRLAAAGEEIIYERIPLFRTNLRREAEELVLQSVGDLESTSVIRFYNNHLRFFFDGPRFFFHHIIESKQPLMHLLARVEAHDRYLSESERQIMRSITELAKTKFNLDYHYSLQSVLKGWLFIHIPLTYVILIFTFVHLILVFTYTGGI